MARKRLSTLFFPLGWPVGYSRTASDNIESSRFRVTFAAARSHLETECEAIGATDIIISTDWPLVGDGNMKPSTRQPDDTGVAVYFTLDGVERVFCCDAWDKVESNLRAIGLTFEMLRAVERYRVSDMMNRLFAGFKSLPENATVNGVTWWKYFNLEPDASPAAIRAAIRAKQKECHPDKHGGNQLKWIELQEIIKQIPKE